MKSPFVELFVDRDQAVLEEEMVEAIKTRFEDWVPADGNPEVWLLKAFARVAAGIFDVAAILTRRAYKTFGETVVRVPPILAAPATVESTWTMIDDDGHVIPAGTVVDIVEGDVAYGFRTVSEVEVPAGKTVTDTGEVLLEAVLPGSEYNALSTNPVLRTSLAAVELDGIELEGVTSGGVDEEDEETYLNRLAEELQTLSICAIRLADYGVIARRSPEVTYATPIDNYDPVTDTFENPLMVAVAVADANTNPLTEIAKAAVKAEIEDRCLQNIVVHVFDYETTEVGAKVAITLRPGYDEDLTIAAAEAALLDYLSPAPDDEHALSIYLNEVIPVVDIVAGVGRVKTVELKKDAGAFAKADVELSGPAALVKPGVIEVTVA